MYVKNTGGIELLNALVITIGIDRKANNGKTEKIYTTAFISYYLYLAKVCPAPKLWFGSVYLPSSARRLVSRAYR